MDAMFVRTHKYWLQAVDYVNFEYDEALFAHNIILIAKLFVKSTLTCEKLYSIQVFLEF